jgi:hypothetical protein
MTTVVSQLSDQTGDARHFIATAGLRPVLTTAGPNSRLCADFDGVDDFMDTSLDLSEFVTAAAKYIVVSIIIDAVTLTSANAFSNHCIIGDAGQKCGIYIASNGAGGAYVYGFNWDGTSDQPVATVALGEPLVISLRHDLGTLYVRVNNGAEWSAASGNTTDLTGDLRVGFSATGTAASIKLFEVATFSCVPPEGTRNAIEQDMMLWVGAESAASTNAELRALMFCGAQAKKSVDQTGVNFSQAIGGAVVTWDTEVFDTDGWHDTGSNTSRMTVPSGLGITKVMVSSHVKLSSNAIGNSCLMRIRKNGSTEYTHIAQLVDDEAAAPLYANVCGMLPATAGDYFEVHLYLNAFAGAADTSVTVEAEQSSFSIMAVG